MSIDSDKIDILNMKWMFLILGMNTYRYFFNQVSYFVKGCENSGQQIAV